MGGLYEVGPYLAIFAIFPEISTDLFMGILRDFSGFLGKSGRFWPYDHYSPILHEKLFKLL